jgi:hypothetical protein
MRPLADQSKREITDKAIANSVDEQDFQRKRRRLLKDKERAKKNRELWGY